MKKIIAFLIACTMLFTVACSNKSENNHDTPVVTVNQKLYKITDISTETEISENLLIESSGDMCLLFYKSADMELVISKINSSGEVVESKVIGEYGDRELVVNLNDDNSFDVISAETDFSFEYADNGYILNYDDFYENGKVYFILRHYSSSCELIFEKEIVGLDEYYSLSTSHLTSLENYGDGFILSFIDGIVQLDINGNVIDFSDYSGYLQFGRDSNGNVIATDNDPGFITMDGKSLTLPKRDFESQIGIPISRAVKGRNGYKLFFAGLDA